MAKKILMVIASNDFRDSEYFEPKNVLEAGGITVVTASNTKTSTGAEGNKVNVNILFNDTKSADYDAIAFIGGPGASEYFDDPHAHALAKEMLSSGKVVSAICAAVATLAKSGILKGKNATCFDGVADKIKAGGANYTAKPVEVDGKIITANGPGAATSFGTALANALSGTPHVGGMV